MSPTLSAALQGPVIVTGATGFVGANLCTFLAQRGATVIALDGPSGRPWRAETLPPSVRRVQLDLCEENDVRKFIRETQPAYFLNLAAYGAYSNQTEAKRIYHVNFEAVRIILDELQGVSSLRAFIQAGSSSEYGLNCTAPGEGAQTLPDSHYAVSKVAATALTQFYGKKYGMPAWVFRLYSVYGPLEDTSRLIPKLLMHAQDRKLPPLVHPDISRDFIHTADVCHAFKQLMCQASTVARGEIFNIGSGSKTTLGELVEIARREFDISNEPQWGSMPNRHWDHPDWYANPQKACDHFGWSAQTSLAKGLRSTIEWMRDYPEQLALAEQNNVMGPTK